MTAIALTGAVTLAAPLYAQSAGAGLYPPPDESALITLVGCLQRVQDHGDKYVLSDVAVGPATSVPEARCTGSSNTSAIQLEHGKRFAINDTMIGRWVEASGRLEKETSDNPQNLRELHVRSFRMVPVVPPQQAVVIAPAPRDVEPPPIAQQLPSTEIPAAEPAPAAPEAVGTSGQAEEPLPKTAGEAPAIALFGLLSLAGAFGLRWYYSRARA